MISQRLGWKFTDPEYRQNFPVHKAFSPVLTVWTGPVDDKIQTWHMATHFKQRRMILQLYIIDWNRPVSMKNTIQSYAVKITRSTIIFKSLIYFIKI